MAPVPLGLAARAGFRHSALGPLRRAVERAAKAVGGSRLVVHNLPPCVLPRLDGRVGFAGTKPYMEMLFAHGAQANFGRLLERTAAFVPACDECTERVACAGLGKHLLRAGVRPARSFAGLRVSE